MRKRSIPLLSALLLAATPVASHDYRAGDIRIDHPWTRATPPNANVAGGYMTLENGGADDRLLAGSSPLADRVEIHSTEIVDSVARMRPLPDGLDLPAGETVAIEPGGFHLMLIGLDRPLAEGERVPLTLEFQNAGPVEVELAVDAMGSGAAHDGHGGH